MTVGYFSSEFATREDIPTYSGGLGILAGDTAKTAADRKANFVGVTLLYPQGYATQDGSPQQWDPQKAGLVKLDDIVDVPFGDRTIKVGAWLEPVISPENRHIVPLIRLDTNVEGNTPEDKAITGRLYENATKLQQFAVLGIGGTLMLQRLGYQVSSYHMNEGHSSLGALVGLQQEGGRLEAVAAKRRFFNHSTVQAALSTFLRSDLEDLFKKLASCDGKLFPESISDCVGRDFVDTNRLAAILSGGKMYGVSEQHAMELRGMFPGFQVGHVTNGVHPRTWVTEKMAELYDKHIGREWRIDPDVFRKAENISPSDFWDAHMAGKEEGMRELSKLLKIPLDPSVFTVGFARRAATYKDFELLLNPSNSYMLEQLPRQIYYFMAAKPHPADGPGRAMLERAIAVGARLNSVVKFVFIPEYDLNIARLMFMCSDLWLNHPLHAREACGTSGMKAALNGIPNASKLEGWFYEAAAKGIIQEGVTGWIIGQENPHLSAIAAIRSAQDAYYSGRMANMMPTIVSRLGPEYHSGRMFGEYKRLWELPEKTTARPQLVTA